MNKNIHISQPGRLILIFLNFFILCVLNLILFGKILPDVNSASSIWFYVAALMIIFSNYLIEPFYSKPVDIISSSVTFLIALLGVNQKDFLGWNFLIIIGFTFLLISMVIIFLRDKGTDQVRRIINALFILDTEIGKSAVLFSLLFFAALATYFLTEPSKIIILVLFWFCLVTRATDRLWLLIKRIYSMFKHEVKADYIGKLIMTESPLFGITECTDNKPEVNSLVVVFFPEHKGEIALVVQLLLLNNKQWVKILFLNIDFSGKIQINGNTQSAETEVYLLGDINKFLDLKNKLERNEIYKKRDSLLGFVSENSNIKEINFNIINDKANIREGQLIEVQIGTDNIMYQIINGQIESSNLEKGNQFGYINAKARKIGKWNIEKNGFEMIRWMPQPHAPVFILPCKAGAEEFLDSIGRVPGTDFSVELDCHKLVTHNTAILGILGIGKSYLAYEIINKLLKEEIKIICLDITGQYQQRLKEYANYDSTQDEAFDKKVFEELKTLHGRVHKNVAEGGSIGKFRELIRQDIGNFMVSDAKVKIYNPEKFYVIRQDSRPFQDTASMVELTTAEITRIISEQLLGIVKGMGTMEMEGEEKARICLVFEEAHSLIPEWNSAASEGDQTAANGTAKTILQGRKYGLGCMVITQRTANVTKSILNQCNTIFAMRVFDDTGMGFLSNYIGEDYTNALSTLEDRKAVIFGRASSSNSPLIIQLNDKDLYLKKLKQERGT